jgi:ribosomal 50S subunit-associated protein YjgA (DUF615 family)
MLLSGNFLGSDFVGGNLGEAAQTAIDKAYEQQLRTFVRLCKPAEEILDPSMYVRELYQELE